MTTFFVGEVVTAAQMNAIATKFLGWGQRTTTSTTSTSTTAVTVLRLDGMVWTSGRVIEAGYRCHRDSTTATDNLRTELRFKAGGAAATTSDAILQGSQEFDTPSPSNWSTIYPVSSTDTYSLLLTFARNTGAGTCDLFCDANRIIELFVIDRGVITDTGVDT
jgi:hypothetical protein